MDDGNQNQDQPAASSSAPSPTPGSTTAAPGETLEQIADRVGVDPDALFAANRGVLGSNPDRSIPPGTPLVVPQ